jgi:hypothetical protein
VGFGVDRRADDAGHLHRPAAAVLALGWLDLGLNGATGSGASRAVVSGVLALIAFFLGGAAAGAAALWQRANDGMVNGVAAWAVTVVAVLALALLGGGALLGSLADVRDPVQRPA